MQTSSDVSPKRRRFFLIIKVVGTLMVVALLTFGFNEALRWGVLKISHVEIKMKDDSSSQVLFDRIAESLGPKLNELKGKNILSIGLKEITERVLSDKRVQKVNITRRLPGTLELELVPKHPVLNLLNPDGKLSPISIDASLLPPVDFNLAFDLPVLRGKTFQKDENRRLEALKLIENLPAEGLLNQRSISEIHFENNEGFIVYFEGSGSKIILGEAPFGEKLKRVNQVLNYLHERSMTWRILDARFKKKVVVKLLDQT